MNEYISELTSKFAAAQKSALFINQNAPYTPFPGAFRNIGSFEKAGPGFVSGAPESGAPMMPRYPFVLSFGTNVPVSDKPLTWVNALPASDVGRQLSTLAAGYNTPNDTSAYVALPGTNDTAALLGDSLATGLGYGLTAEALRRLLNWSTYNLTPGTGRNKFLSLKPLNKGTVGQIEGILESRGIPGKKLEVTLGGTAPGTADAQKVLGDRRLLSEFLSLNKQHGISVDDYSAFVKARLKAPELTFNDFKDFRNSLIPATPRNRRARAAPPPLSKTTHIGNVEVSYPGAGKGKGKGNSRLTFNPRTNPHGWRSGRLGLLPWLAGFGAAAIPGVQNAINFGDSNISQVPVRDALPGIPTAAPIMDDSVRQVEDRAKAQGIPIRPVPFK